MKKYTSHNTSRHYMHVAFQCKMQVFRILPLKTLSEQRRKSKLCRTCFMTVAKCIYGNNKPLLNKNSLRTIEAQFVQKKIKNNEARPKLTGSYKKKRACFLLSGPVVCSLYLFIPLSISLEPMHKKPMSQPNRMYPKLQ